MKFLAACLFCFMASAQIIPINVEFTFLDVSDSYINPFPPIPGATVRLVLGQTANWQNPDAGHKFVTDEKGEAHFTMDGLVDTRWSSRSMGFLPFGIPLPADHLKIAVEVERKVEQKTLRWLLTMDLDCLKGGPCSTVGFMGIYTLDAQGRFTKPLARQGGTESWKVPELNDKVVYGMGYQAANFMLTADENDPKKRTLQFAIKRLPH
jgi:hypothetical protein